MDWQQEQKILNQTLGQEHIAYRPLVNRVNSNQICILGQADLLAQLLEHHQTSQQEQDQYSAIPPPAHSKKKIKWKKGQLLGSGQYSTVYQGLNRQNGSLMAVKQVSQANSRVQHSLEAEISLLSELSHPNIVQYLGTCRENKVFFIFLEYVAGGSLQQLARQYQGLNEKVVRLYTRQILMGIQYLHSNDVLHRDIKGANVLVDANGNCKLADFGCSRRAPPTHQNTSLIGTANWMAPEVIRQQGHGRAADIWSLGCTIIEMATGMPPFHQYTNPLAAMYQIAKNKETPGIPDQLSTVAHDFLSLCLRVEPRERASASQLLLHVWLDPSDIIQ